MQAGHKARSVLEVSCSLPPELRLVGDGSAERLCALSDALRTHHKDWALLVGAGLSCDAGLPSWDTLIRGAATRFNVHVGPDVDEDNYPRVAEECLNRAATPADFWKFVEKEVCGSDVGSRLHDLVVGLPFDLYMTTNFDCLLEIPHSRRTTPAPSILEYPLLDPRNGRDGRLVYLHGRCRCENPIGSKLDPSRIVLTRTAYTNAYAADADLRMFLTMVFRYMRVVLVGVSLSDFPIRELLRAAFEAREYRGRRGEMVQRERHLAFVSTQHDGEGVTDFAWRGLDYDVAPIYYHNPPGGTHGALVDILDWLTKSAAPSASLFAEDC